MAFNWGRRSRGFSLRWPCPLAPRFLATGIELGLEGFQLHPARLWRTRRSVFSPLLRGFSGTLLAPLALARARKSGQVRPGRSAVLEVSGTHKFYRIRDKSASRFLPVCLIYLPYFHRITGCFGDACPQKNCPRTKLKNFCNSPAIFRQKIRESCSRQSAATRSTDLPTPTLPPLFRPRCGKMPRPHKRYFSRLAPHRKFPRGACRCTSCA
jgi:hypothetical protein